MPFARLRDLFLTLRFRLVLWVTLVVFVIVTITMVAIGQVVRRSLLTEFDALLRRDLVELRQMLREHPEGPALFERLQHWVDENEDVGFVEIRQARGGLVWRSSAAPVLPVPTMDGATYHDFQNLRYLESHDAALDRVLRVGVARDHLEDDLALVNRFMLLATISILTLTPLAGFFLAARATRPLQRIIATTARLQPRRLNERLPLRGTGDELDQLSATINGMLDRIATYIQRNQDFIASAAHELRSPLAAIRSSVEVALNRPRSNEEYAILLEDVMEECGRLGNLVDRLLLLAEGDAGQVSFTLHTARLDKIVRESVDMFQGVAEAQEVPLILLGLEAATVRGDEQHLRQVVRNLIDNALKFTTPPGRVEVELTPSARPGFVCFRVKDQGIGIAAEDVPHIFERFYRGDKSRQRGVEKSGTGLGLSICQSIVLALEGNIHVESDLGRGSVFVVELPRAPSS